MKWGRNIPFYGQENSYYMALDTEPYIILLTQIQFSVYLHRKSETEQVKAH